MHKKKKKYTQSNKKERVNNFLISRFDILPCFSLLVIVIVFTSEATCRSEISSNVGGRAVSQRGKLIDVDSVNYEV